VTVRFDEAEVDRVAQGLTLALPRAPHRGKVGDVRASSVGASLEIHDFRSYQPGDDLRQLDWNAVARTGELILRVRQDEVSPRVEVVLDASRSMALSPEKAARACEVALLLCTLAVRSGLEPSLTVADATPRRAAGQACAAALRGASFEGRDALPVALARCPPLRACGLRAVVSDFLFEAPLERFAEGLARSAAGLAWVQLLDPEDVDPAGGFGARLVDSESGEALERILTPGVLSGYRERLDAHQRLLRGAVHRVHATWASASVEAPLGALARSSLRALVAEGA
jgi:uncharacterized protein (DUF58 family)